jgi:[acyl-carrier-protein] S-malonyltransferase
MAGTFRPGPQDGPGGADSPAGQRFDAGAELGHVIARGEKHPLLAPCAGDIVEWLAEDGDPVSAGQPLVRLQPEAQSPR